MDTLAVEDQNYFGKLPLGRMKIAGALGHPDSACDTAHDPREQGKGKTHVFRSPYKEKYYQHFQGKCYCMGL